MQLRPIVLAALLGTSACTPLPGDGWPDDVTRDSATDTPPTRAEARVLAERDAGGDVEPVIVRRVIEDDVILTWATDGRGGCCTAGRMPLHGLGSDQ